jgi:dihydropteroate synthase
MASVTQHMSSPSGVEAAVRRTGAVSTPRFNQNPTSIPALLVAREATLVPDPFLIAGIVNLTPDSFSDGGSYAEAEQAIAHALRLEAEGARILDLGAESTRPGADAVGSEEEQRRLMPALQALVALREQGKSHAVLAVDTFRAATAARALEAGAEMINDISGGVFEPAILSIAAEYRAGYVLGHCPARPKVMREHPRADDIVENLLRHFEAQMSALLRAGLPEECICLDPCIGFGKDLADTAQIFQNISRLHELGRPLYFGLSRKSFLGTAAGAAVHERDALSAVAVALCAADGVTVHRVHDVSGAAQALALVRALYHPTA